MVIVSSPSYLEVISGYWISRTSPKRFPSGDNNLREMGQLTDTKQALRGDRTTPCFPSLILPVDVRIFEASRAHSICPSITRASQSSCFIWESRYPKFLSD
ncbi:hypothetical protein Tco_0553069 [Tanacetum coccineum]